MGVYTFSQDNLIIPLNLAGATAGTAAEMDSFNMRGYDQATVIFTQSASVAGNNVLTMETGASNSADTSDATFHYRWGSATVGASNSDKLTADATASTLTMTATTYQGKMLVIELHADELPKSGETVYSWVTPDIDGTATKGFISGIAILSKPRYAKAVMPTAVS